MKTLIHELTHDIIADPDAFRTAHEGVGEGSTLLVVDDEPSVREFMAQVLCQEGYNVLQADGAKEALRVATAATIHLLLTDFSMPEIDGLELTRRFRAVYPKAPVLMVSGSLVAGLVGRYDDLDRFGILEKPFAVGDLIRKVRSLLIEASPLPSRFAESGIVRDAT